MTPSTPEDPSQNPSAESEPIEATAPETTPAADQEAVDTETPAAVEAGAEDAEAAADDADQSEAAGTAAAETGIDKTAAQTLKPSAGTRRRDSRSAADPDLVVRAQAKYVRTSARKARLVSDQIRGKDVAEAQAILAFTPRAVAKPWAKLLTSAVANAEHNHELVSDDLRILAVYADEGPTIKRFRPRAMGRATSIRKRTSHLTIALGPKTGPNRKGGR